MIGWKGFGEQLDTYRFKMLPKRVKLWASSVRPTIKSPELTKNGPAPQHWLKATVFPRGRPKSLASGGYGSATRSRLSILLFTLLLISCGVLFSKRDLPVSVTVLATHIFNACFLPGRWYPVLRGLWLLRHGGRIQCATAAASPALRSSSPGRTNATPSRGLSRGVGQKWTGSATLINSVSIYCFHNYRDWRDSPWTLSLEIPPFLPTYLFLMIEPACFGKI